MAEAGGPAQTGPVAAPAPVREKRPPGHAQTEAEFFADETAGLIGGRYGIPNGMLAAAAAAAPGTPDDVGSLLGRLDGRRARGLAFQLQRTMGNGGLHAVLAATRPSGPHANGSGHGELAVAQRQPTNQSTPPPNASQAPDPETLLFEGHELRFDRAVLYPILKKMQTDKGLSAPAEFVGRLRNANPVLLFKGTERPGLYLDILKGLDDANAQLDHERDDWIKEFESKANGVAADLLDKSRRTIEAELERLGITGGVIRGPNEAIPNFRLTHADAANDMRQAARELIPFATTAEKTGRESAAALARLSESQKTDPFNLMNRGLMEDHEDKRKKWLAAEEDFEKQRRTRVAAQPGLAMYCEEPGRADKLAKLAATDDTQLANNVGMEARKRLMNIDEVKPQIGGKFNVWHQAHLQRVTLDALNANRPQREAVDWKTRAVQRADAEDQMLFSLVAIGLGLIAAIPTGGSSLIAAVGAVAAAAGAGLALYQAGKSASAYALAAAANATDFDKAKAISEDDPSGMQLALDIVTAIGDVFMAAAAFKALNGIVKAAKAGEVASALKVAETAEQVGLKGAARNKIVGEAIAGLPDEAIEQVAHTAATTGGSKINILERLNQLATKKQFQGEVAQALKIMEHVEGRIPDTARRLVKSGRVRVFTEQSLIEVYGESVGRKKWADLAYAGGFYSPQRDIVFIRAGNSAEDLAGTLIHEATHRVSKANPLAGNNFMNEAMAEFAERDFYMTLYARGGPLEGKAVTSPRIRQFLSWSDEELMADIERRYFDAKKELPLEKRVKFLNAKDVTADQVVDQIFKDIAFDYQASLPKSP